MTASDVERRRGNDQQWVYSSCEVETGNPGVSGEMTDRRPSARDHTLTLTLKLLISVSFGDYLWQYFQLSQFTGGYNGCGTAWLSGGENRSLYKTKP